MRNICERSAVHDCWSVLERLYQVGSKSILEKHGHRTICIEIACQHWLLFASVGNHDISEATLEILKRCCEAENRHHLGGHHDVETIFSWISVSWPAEGDHDVAERTVVHINHTLPGDSANINVESIAVVNVIIQKCG